MEAVLSRLRDKKRAPGPDGVHGKVLSLALVHLEDPLRELFDQCLQSGQFPKGWKRGRLVLLPKGGRPPDQASAVRPIVLLNEVGKALERIVASRLVQHLEEGPGPKLSNHQYGFRAGRSTVDAMRYLRSVTQEAEREGDVVLGVSLDIANAFNSLPHSVILGALEYFGVPLYIRRLVGDWLSDREVVWENRDGVLVLVEVDCGVPQGSALGPGLWVIGYDWVLRCCLLPGMGVSAYADDTFITARGRTYQEAARLTESAVSLVVSRIRRLGLRVRFEKTEALMFRGPGKRGPPPGARLRVGDEEIRVSPTIKYLGLTLDGRWTFGPHFQQLGPKVIRAASSLGRLLPNVGGPSQACRQLYSGVCRSMALYGAPIWVDALTVRNRALLHKMQRVIAVRVIRGYRTVSWAAATALAGEPPWELTARVLAELNLLITEGRSNGEAPSWEELRRFRRLGEQWLLRRWGEDLAQTRQKKKGVATPAKAAPRKKKRKAKLRAPATAAITLTLGANAAEKGVKYSDVLLKAKNAVTTSGLAELDIQKLQLRFRLAQTGARVLTIPGEGAQEKADALAEKLREVLDPDVVKVGRPAKCVEMRITGLDDSATTAEVIEAVSREGGCPANSIRSGPIRKGRWGDGSVWLSVPVAAAKKLISLKRLQVGWVSAKPEHKAAECREKQPNCFFCEALGKDKDHVLGSSGCVTAKPLPSTKRRKRRGAPSEKARPKEPGAGGAGVRQPQPAMEISEEEISRGGVVLVVSLDITNAFNTLPWETIKEGLRYHRVPRYLRRTISNYLSERSVEYPTEEGWEDLEVDCGVPQGSSLGPGLWDIGYDYVLRGANLPGVELVAYADDTAVVCRAKSHREAKILATAAVAQVVRRIQALGLTVALNKSEALLFHGPRNAPPPDLEVIVSGTRIKIAPTMTYLGLALDSRWSFKEHFRRLSEKVKKSAGALASLLPNLGGPSLACRRLYMGVVRSMAMYGAPIWAENLLPENRLALGRLQRVMATRAIRGYRTISRDAACLLAGSVPWDLDALALADVYWRGAEVRAGGSNPLPDAVRRWRDRAREVTIELWEERLLEPQVSVALVLAMRPVLREWLTRKHGALSFRLTQVLTGHGCFGRYLCEIANREESTRCHHCDCDRDTAEHTVSACPSWTGQRAALTAAIGFDLSLPALVRAMVGSEPGWTAVQDFCEDVIAAKEEAERMRELEALDPRRRRRPRRRQVIGNDHLPP
ncbi:uncharacterized protein LOC121740348 [Aricia agestis]|uniref:uncharacterized protein LOC121740348 n=1 Tax=Aricia agestis TaxID=91739 RepID=UPI001C20B2D4|nr:uncharacterized protein LOC121740348 [Aricia agestis]